MRTQDRFFLIIVLGIVSVALIALFLAASQPEQTYSDGVEPDDIAHDYLLAIQKEDMERSFAYLSSDLDSSPESPEQFRSQLSRSPWEFPTQNDQSIGLTVLSADVVGERAFVEVRLTRFVRNGIWDSNSHTRTFELQLAREGEDWKIVDGEYFFLQCWKAGDCLQ